MDEQLLFVKDAFQVFNKFRVKAAFGRAGRILNFLRVIALWSKVHCVIKFFQLFLGRINVWRLINYFEIVGNALTRYKTIFV